MRLTRVVLILAASGVAVAACGSEPPPEPEPVVRVDTVVVTDTVAPEPPEGRPADLCLATGQNIQIYISPRGDTLVGPNRVALRDLRGVAFAGDYAGDEPWFNQDEDIEFMDQRYGKFGGEQARDCTDVQIVGEHMGVNLFADDDADSPYETIYVPVSPGAFQPYETGVAEVRG